MNYKDKYLELGDKLINYVVEGNELPLSVTVMWSVCERYEQDGKHKKAFKVLERSVTESVPHLNI